MKKLFAFAIAAVLTLSLTVSVFAATVTEVPGSETNPVEIVINNDSINDDPVYSVDIEWESLKFTYTISGSEWDPETHSYPGSWDKSSASIDVTNHSNQAVNVEAAFPASATTDTEKSVTATLTNNSFELATAVGTAVADAPTNTVTVSITGAPDVTESYTFDNQITVAITAA